MIIVPNGFDYSNYPKQWVGTGHFMMSSYTTNVGATFVRNPHYWGTPAIPSEVQWTFYASEEPMSNALVANEIDCLDQFFVSTSPQLLNGNLQHHQVEGLRSPRDLDALRHRSVQEQPRPPGPRPYPQPSPTGEARSSRDMPTSETTAPSLPSSPRLSRVPQRAQNIAQAKKLLAQAGYARGFSTPFITEQRQEMPELAQFIKTWAKEIGVDINLTIEQPDKYYGSAVYRDV